MLEDVSQNYPVLFHNTENDYTIWHGPRKNIREFAYLWFSSSKSGSKIGFYDVLIFRTNLAADGDCVEFMNSEKQKLFLNLGVQGLP